LKLKFKSGGKGERVGKEQSPVQAWSEQAVDAKGEGMCDSIEVNLVVGKGSAMEGGEGGKIRERGEAFAVEKF
jgi:hypothetical protein